MIFTLSGVYNKNEPPANADPEEPYGQFTNLLEGTDYEYKYGYIDTETVLNNDNSTQTNLYLICTRENNIYYWDGNTTGGCKKLEGTYTPPYWQPNHDYNQGDIIIPPQEQDTGYMYICEIAGRSGSSITNITPAQNTTTQFQDGTVSWRGVGTYGLEGSPYNNSDMQARFVTTYRGFVFVANLVEGGKEFPSRLRWSQWQNPRLWHNNEDGSGMAGYVDVDDVEGEILAIKKLNDILVVYKEKGIIAVTFTGGDTVFSKEVITTRAGLISSGAIIELPHSQIFVGEDNIYEFDGSSVTPIGESIRDYFFETLSPLHRDKVIGYYDKRNGEVLFIYDKATKYDFLGLEADAFQRELNTTRNRNVALTYNIRTKTWARREMYITAIGEFCQTQNKIINNDDRIIDYVTSEQIDSSYGLKDAIVTMCGDENGNMYELSGQVDSRYEYEGYCLSKTHHMDEPGLIKRLLRIQFHIETDKNCTLVVDVGTGWNSESQMEKWETHNLNLQSPKPPFVDVDLSARYFQIRFGTKRNNEYFKVLGYTLYYQLRGDE